MYYHEITYEYGSEEDKSSAHQMFMTKCERFIGYIILYVENAIVFIVKDNKSADECFPPHSLFGLKNKLSYFELDCRKPIIYKNLQIISKKNFDLQLEELHEDVIKHYQITYKYDSEEDKINIIEVFKRFCKRVNRRQHLIIDVGHSIVTIVTIKQPYKYSYIEHFRETFLRVIKRVMPTWELNNTFIWQDVTENPTKFITKCNNFQIVINSNFDYDLLHNNQEEQDLLVPVQVPERKRRREECEEHNECTNVEKSILKVDMSTQTDDCDVHLDNNFVIVINKLQKLKRENLMKFLITMDNLKKLC
jgi:hypothetical protein